MNNKRNFIFLYLIIGIFLLESCIKQNPSPEATLCDKDTSMYREQKIDLENHSFSFLLPDDYFLLTNIEAKARNSANFAFYPDALTRIKKSEDLEALFGSNNNQKNYFAIEAADKESYMNVDSFEQSIKHIVKNLSLIDSYSVVYSECHKTDKYKYSVVISFDRSPTDKTRDTIVSEFIWHVLYDNKLYWCTLHSEDHVDDFSYESKKYSINSIRIK